MSIARRIYSALHAIKFALFVTLVAVFLLYFSYAQALYWSEFNAQGFVVEPVKFKKSLPTTTSETTRPTTIIITTTTTLIKRIASTTALVSPSLSLTPLKTIPQGKRSFSEKHIPTLEKLDLIDPSVRFDETVIFDHDPVFVSAWSSDHQNEAMILGKSLSEFSELPPERKKLLAYNIGLTQEEINDYQNKFGKMVEFRQFNFSKYPSYVKDLMQYRWKPLIIAEALLEFPVVWWVDSVMPFTNSKERTLRRLHDSIKNDPKHLAFGISGGTGHSIFAATHPEMFEFFPMPEEKAKNLTMADASHMLWFATRRTRGELLKAFVSCALEEDCMSPPGAYVFCQFKPDRYLYYANCHRYDQSAITIIATLITDYHTEQYFLNRSLSPIKVP